MKEMLSALIKTKLFQFGLQAFKFVAVGLPMFGASVLINIFMVETLHWPKWLSYAIALYVQVTVNFFLCRWLVFSPSKTKSIWEQYIGFLSVVAVFRVLDWGTYTVLVSTTQIHYIIIQCANVVVFSLAKFYFSKRTIEGEKDCGCDTPVSKKNETDHPNSMPQ